jgi:hypothetical protein
MQNDVDQAIAGNTLLQTVERYSKIFRERFCIAAAEIAGDIKTPLQDIGVLFDEIITTCQKRKEISEQETEQKREADPENSISSPSIRGDQLLLLVSRVRRRKAADLQASGYRFANISNVLTRLIQKMQVDRDNLSRQLQAMSDYVDEGILEHGIYLACFIIRPSIQSEFDVLVCNDVRNQIPTLRLPLDQLESWAVDYLQTLDGLSVATCTAYLSRFLSTAVNQSKEQLFVMQLLETLKDFIQKVAEPFINDALLFAQAIQAPCRGVSKNAQLRRATLITFTLLAPIPCLAKDSKYRFTPLRFFETRQHVYKNSLDQDIFAYNTFCEFAPFLDLDTESSVADNRSVSGGNEMQTGEAMAPKERISSMALEQESETFTDKLFKICIDRGS